MYHVYVYSWVLVCALSIHSGTHVLKSCDHPLSSHQQLLIQSRATAACMVGHINFLLKPAQPGQFFFFRCIIDCGAHNSVGQVQIIALHVWVTFACNGLGCYQLKYPTDEMGDGEEPRKMRAALESRPRAVPFIHSCTFTFTDRNPSKSTRERGVRPPAHSICCNLFLFCPLICPLRF